MQMSTDELRRNEMKANDMELLRQYARQGSEQAFGELVSRHVSLLYSVALRQVRDPNLAEEITQAVFIILARKAKSLGPKTILSGWLCRTTRYVSGRALRTERRRQFRSENHASRLHHLGTESKITGSKDNPVRLALPHHTICFWPCTKNGTPTPI